MIEQLLKPGRIGNMELKNRIIYSSCPFIFPIIMDF